MPAASPALVVRDLRVDLAPRGAPIVADISLTLAPGEILGLVGESGSGKTTLANALLGYARRGTRITGGSVLVDGQDILALTDGERRAARGRLIAHVPQDPAMALNPLARIGGSLSETLAIHRRELPPAARAAAVAAALADVGLPNDPAFLRRYPHQLSGGQQQRVLLALAFILRPRVIVLDEPTTALDVITQAQVLDLIRGYCREQGVAAVYISHDLSVVQDLVDRAAVLYAGRLAEVADSRAIFAQPMHPYTRGLLGAMPGVDRRHALSHIPGHAPSPGQRPDGCAFAPRCARATDLCRATEPRLTEGVSGTFVACHHPLLQTPLERRTAQPSTPAPADRPALLTAAGIDAYYGANQVLFDVGFSVRGRARPRSPAHSAGWVPPSPASSSSAARRSASDHPRAPGTCAAVSNISSRIRSARSTRVKTWRITSSRWFGTFSPSAPRKRASARGPRSRASRCPRPCSIAGPGSFRAASVSGSRSRGRCCASPRC